MINELKKELNNIEMDNLYEKVSYLAKKAKKNEILILTRSEDLEYVYLSGAINREIDIEEVNEFFIDYGGYNNSLIIDAEILDLLSSLDELSIEEIKFIKKVLPNHTENLPKITCLKNRFKLKALEKIPSAEFNIKDDGKTVLKGLLIDLKPLNKPKKVKGSK